MTTTAQQQLLNITAADMAETPFPHLVKQPFLNPELYERLRREWPTNEMFDRTVGLPGARTGRDIYRGSDLYREHLRNSDAWSEFDDFIKSGDYSRSVMELFGAYLEAYDCAVEKDRVRYVDDDEGRSVLAQSARPIRRRVRLAYNLMKKTLLSHWRKNNLFVHLALHQSPLGYEKTVHCDRTNRLTTNVIYFCDKEELQMDGGDLRIHQHKEQAERPSAYPRHPKDEDTDVIATLAPAHNLGSLLLDCNKSLHSVSKINKMQGYRNWIYVCVSSQEDIVW